MSKQEDIKKLLNDLAPDLESTTPESGSISNSGDASGINNTQVSGGHIGSIVGSIVHNHVSSNESKITVTGERRTINRLADRLENEFDQSRAEVWRDIHETFGINAAKNLRQEQIKPAEKILYLQIEIAELRRTITEGETQRKVREEKIKQDRDKDAKTLSKLKQQNEQLENERARSQNKLQNLEFSYKKELENMHANLASVKSRAAAPDGRYRKTLIVTALMLVGAITATGYLWTKNTVLMKDMAAVQARSRVCQFEKKSYPSGSTVIKSNKIAMECVGGTDQTSPQWFEVKSKPEKKITPLRKMTDDSFDQQDIY